MNNMRIKYYKVVIREEDKLYSAWTKIQELNRCIKEYKIGKQTKGRGTKLFIFKTLEDAEAWVSFHLITEQVEIYECIATGVISSPKYVPSICDLVNIHKESNNFWKSLYRWWEKRTMTSIKLSRECFQYTPSGTVLANSVTLLRKV